MNTKLSLALGAAFSLGLAACATESTDAAAIAPATADVVAAESTEAAPADAVIEPASATADAMVETTGESAEATMVKDEMMVTECDAEMIAKDTTLSADDQAAKLKECMMAKEAMTPVSADAAEGAIEPAVDAAAEAVEPAPQN